MNLVGHGGERSDVGIHLKLHLDAAPADPGSQPEFISRCTQRAVTLQPFDKLTVSSQSRGWIASSPRRARLFAMTNHPSAESLRLLDFRFVG